MACRQCGFAFVQNPWTDYEAIYSEEYYAGRGVDPLVDYEQELVTPEQSIRTHEWQGLVKVVRSLIPLKPSTQWLDFGCGVGGLVQFVRKAGVCDIVGFDTGLGVRKASQRGIPVLNREALDSRLGTFDVVTAIEVIEHLENPLEILRLIRSLLKPGGLFLYTTGNKTRYRNDLLNWRYVLPEIHISFFEPMSTEAALRRTGFRPEYVGYRPGFTDIIRFKILKNVRSSRRSAWQSVIPWPIVSRLADAYFGVTAFPVGWADNPKATG